MVQWNKHWSASKPLAPQCGALEHHVPYSESASASLGASELASRIARPDSCGVHQSISSNPDRYLIAYLRVRSASRGRVYARTCICEDVHMRVLMRVLHHNCQWTSYYDTYSNCAARYTSLTTAFGSLTV